MFLKFLGLRAKLIGTFSLAGTQVKFPARPLYQLACQECDWSIKGHISDGYFIPSTEDIEEEEETHG